MPALRPIEHAWPVMRWSTCCTTRRTNAGGHRRAQRGMAARLIKIARLEISSLPARAEQCSMRHHVRRALARRIRPVEADAAPRRSGIAEPLVPRELSSGSIEMRDHHVPS